MNYKDTILNQSDMQWEKPKMKESNDGNIDLDIHIPLTDMLNLQAKRSFIQGVAECIKWSGSLSESKIEITAELLERKFLEWGIEISIPRD